MARKIVTIGLFLSCICINIALPQRLKYTYLDSYFAQKMTEEYKDEKFSQLLKEAHSYSMGDRHRKSQWHMESLKKAAELYEQIINDYPEYLTTILAQRYLFAVYYRMHLLTDDNIFKEKAISSAYKAIDRINNTLSSGIKSEFLEWLRNELIVDLIQLEEEIPESQVKAAKDFYLMGLSDKISTALLSVSYLRLSEIYIEEKNIPQAMKYINKGLALANKPSNKGHFKGFFLFLATMAMRASGDEKKADEFYEQLMEVEQPDSEIKRIIDKRLSRKYGIKLSETPSEEE